MKPSDAAASLDDKYRQLGEEVGELYFGKDSDRLYKPFAAVVPTQPEPATPEEQALNPYLVPEDYR